jgi:cell division transport system permease protein
MRTLGYSVVQAAAALVRRPRRAATSILTSAAALLVLAAFLLVTGNLDSLLARWARLAELSVYFRDDATPADQAAADRLLSDSGLVSGREFVSKAEASKRFKRDFPDLAAAADDAEGNPFPASIDVRLRPERADEASLERLASGLARMPGVADVRYDRRWLERLVRLTAFVRAVGWALAAILVVASALTVSSVVRLGLHERRDEIDIMELVGAPFSYIRGPFVVEGIVQGGLGALLALGAAWLAFAAARARAAALLADFIDPGLVRFLPWSTVALLVVGGMAVGCAGGLLACRPASPDGLDGLDGAGR